MTWTTIQLPEQLPGCLPRPRRRHQFSTLSMDHIRRVRRICLALPEASEKEAWGEPTFRVRNKLFAMYSSATNHHGRGREGLWCNAPLGVQEALVRSAPEKFFVPPYVGVKGWIGMYLDKVSDEEVEAQVIQSYCMIAPKKLQALVNQ